jgi:predicted Na+-dependent transporter
VPRLQHMPSRLLSQPRCQVSHPTASRRTHTPPLPALAQVVLLPVVAGAAINTAMPKAVARLGPLFSLTAVLLIALICGSVVGTHQAAVLQAGPRLLGAVAALHIGENAAGSSAAGWERFGGGRNGREPHARSWNVCLVTTRPLTLLAGSQAGSSLATRCRASLAYLRMPPAPTASKCVSCRAGALGTAAGLQCRVVGPTAR